MRSGHPLRLVDFDNPEKFIKKTLQKLANFEQPQDKWLDVYMLKHHEHEFSHQAYDYLEQVIKSFITTILKRAREKVGIVSPEVASNHIGYKDAYEDEKARNRQMKLEIRGLQKPEYSDLKKWSVLYHKYFVVHNLNLQAFKDVCGISEKHVRNHLNAGIKALTQQLIGFENTLYEKNRIQYVLDAHTLTEQTAESLVNLAQNARSLDGETVALKRCDEALLYAHNHKLPMQYTKAATIKAFILLQNGHDGVVAASNLLTSVEQDKLIYYLPDSPERSWVLAKLHVMKAHIKRRQGNLRDARLTIAQSVKSLEKLYGADMALFNTVYTVQAVMYWASGKYDEAITSLHYLLEKSPQNTYAPREMLGLSYWSSCEYNKAEQNYRMAIKDAETRQDNWHVACMKGNLGLVYLSQGKLQRSKTFIESHRMLAGNLDSQKEFNRATANLGLVYLHQGKLQQAITMLEQGKHVYDKMSAFESQVSIYTCLSQAYTICGQHEQALALAKEAHAIADSIIGAYPPTLIALRCLGECTLLDTDERINYLKIALRLCKSHRLYDKAAILLGLAYLSVREHERTQLMDQGIALMRRIGAQRWLNMVDEGYPHLLLVV